MPGPNPGTGLSTPCAAAGPGKTATRIIGRGALQNAAIIGVGQSAYTRRPEPGQSTHTLPRDAVVAALADAGVDARDVQGMAVASFSLAPDTAVDLHNDAVPIVVKGGEKAGTATITAHVHVPDDKGKTVEITTASGTQQGAVTTVTFAGGTPALTLQLADGSFLTGVSPATVTLVR